MLLVCVMKEYEGVYYSDSSAAFCVDEKSPIWVEQKTVWTPEPIWRLWRTGNALASAEIRTKILRSSRSSPGHYTDRAILVPTMINILIL